MLVGLYPVIFLIFMNKRKKLKYWINLFNKPPRRTKSAPKLILTAGRRERERDFRKF